MTSVPLSPAAQALLTAMRANPRPQTIDQLRATLQAAGEPLGSVIGAVAECVLQRKLRKVPTWPELSGPTYYELVLHN